MKTIITDIIICICIRIGLSFRTGGITQEHVLRSVMPEDGVLESVGRMNLQMRKVRRVGQANVGEVNLHVLEVEGIVELVIALVVAAAVPLVGAEVEGVAVIVELVELRSPEISSGMGRDRKGLA